MNWRQLSTSERWEHARRLWPDALAGRNGPWLRRVIEVMITHGVMRSEAMAIVRREEQGQGEQGRAA